MAIAGPGSVPNSSPTNASSDPRGGRVLDGPPPMPDRQMRGGNPLFTPPMGGNQQMNPAMGSMGNDPTIQLMEAQKNIDMAIQTMAVLAPGISSDLAQLQMAFRQLSTAALMSLGSGAGNPANPMMAGGGMQPGIMPPLPMEGGAIPGMQQGIQI